MRQMFLLMTVNFLNKHCVIVCLPPIVKVKFGNLRFKNFNVTEKLVKYRSIFNNVLLLFIIELLGQEEILQNIDRVRFFPLKYLTLHVLISLRR